MQSNKHKILITGANSGFGFFLSKKFEQYGHKIFRHNGRNHFDLRKNEDIEKIYDKEELKRAADINNDISKNDEIFHQVVIEQAFVIGTTEVTQELFERVLGKNPASLDVNNCSRVGNKSSPNPKFCQQKLFL